MDGKKDGAPVKPITIMTLMVLFTTILLLSTRWTYSLSMLISFYVLSLLDKKKALRFILVFFLCYLFLIFIHDYISFSDWLGAIYTMALIMTKLYPLWILSIAMTSYTSSEIMNSLRKLRLPNPLCISLAIFFRFLPDYIDYFKEVKEGLKVRGLSFSIKNLSKSLEVYIVPMMYKAFQTGEVISASIMTKGIEYPCQKTSYRSIQMGNIDRILIVVGIFLLVVTVWIKYFQ